MRSAAFTIKVGGDYACFTRPEFKVERASYLVMTPSAARGVLEAIFWRPAFRWEVRAIGVMKPIKQTSLLRNEIDGRSDRPFFVEDARVQRASVLLRDVAYLIKAEMCLRPQVSESILKYSDQFERRLNKGQCHHTPCLGTREFAASFERAADRDTALSELTLDLGLMLFDIAYCEDSNRSELTFRKHDNAGPRIASGHARALFFDAWVRQGWLPVPPEKYQELYALENGRAP